MFPILESLALELRSRNSRPCVRDPLGAFAKRYMKQVVLAGLQAHVEDSFPFEMVRQYIVGKSAQ